MDYLVFLVVGFGLGLVFGLHIAETMLLDIQRKLQQLEQQILVKPAPPADADLAEDFA